LLLRTLLLRLLLGLRLLPGLLSLRRRWSSLLLLFFLPLCPLGLSLVLNKACHRHSCKHECSGHANKS
jgi:hypothetical protein